MKEDMSKKQSLGRSFHRLWTASFASNLADGLLKTAAPLLAASLTRDPLLISALGALAMLPWLLFAIPVGGLVDRVDRRKALATANGIRFLVAAFVAFNIASGSMNIWLLFAGVFVMGVAEVVFDTTAQSMIPQVLRTDHVERGNARLQTTEMVVGEFVGTPISGILYAALAFLPFLSSSVGYALAAVLVLLIPVNFAREAGHEIDGPAEPRSKGTYWADVRFGIRYLYEDKTLLKLVLLTTAIGFWFSASSSTQVLFMLNELHIEERWFGFVFIAFGLGAVSSSLVATKLTARFKRGNVMALAILMSGVLTLAQAFVPNVWLFLPILFISGTQITLWNILLMSSYHNLIPNHLFGRIHGTRRTLVWGLMPIGSLLGGYIATFGLRMPLLIGGILSTAFALYGYRFMQNLGNKTAADAASAT